MYPDFSFPLIGVILLIGAGIFYFLHKRRERSREMFIENYRFHPGVLERFKKLHPELDEAQQKEVVEGFKVYFKMHLKARKSYLAMPSKVVDDLWHEFILFTKQYTKFSTNALGYYLHHVPAEVMSPSENASDALKNSWKHACHLEEINPNGLNRIPKLFALDKHLNIKDGFYYARHSEKGSGVYDVSNVGLVGTLSCISAADGGDTFSGSSDLNVSSCSSCNSCGGGD